MSAEQGLTEAPEQFHQADAHAEDGGGYEIGEDGQRISPGMGQSKSSRRRRRKRKGKGEDGAPGTENASGGDSSGAGHIASVQAGSVQAGSDGSGDAPSISPVMPGESISAGAQSHRGNGTAQPGNGQPRGFGGPNPQNGQNGNAPGGTKRWKKKNFRDRDRPGRPGGGENPGNNFAQGGGSQGFSNNNGGGQGFSSNGGGSNNGGGFRGADTHQPGNNAFKRKGGGGGGGFGQKQGRSGGGGSRGGFVGPMDHSYRAPNGNVFDPNASTVDHGGRRSSHTGDSQPIDYSQGRAIPIKEGTPTKIYFFIDDLFFTAKISETARKLGVKIAFVKNEKEQIAALTSGEDEDRPGLIVFDLNNANAKPLTLIPKLKTKLKKTTSIIGFLSHLQGDLKAKAVEAGCDTVMPRAAFSQNLPNLLRRYGIEEADDHTNFNQ